MQLHCRSCGRPSGTDFERQAKSFDSCMQSYFIRYDESGAVRLYLLDRPSDRRFWRPWTEQEIEESARMAERKGSFALWRKKPLKAAFCPMLICRSTAVSVLWANCRTSGWNSMARVDAGNSWSTDQILRRRRHRRQLSTADFSMMPSISDRQHA